MVAGEDGINASGIVCLGYPLKGMNGSIRDGIILQLTVPIMFVQGSKDSLCPLDKLSAVRKKMDSINEVHVVDGGDHSFKIAKKNLLSSRSTQEAAEDQASEAIAEFVTKYVGES
ncbi:hypothetical protein AQUCO_03700098v1 [Aquilegia coerulea]|uniref:KANL3/Tex30 alpha/beta hydrolase-like domain-containing protein n=1 Tax=Aquilegia coerulea TaxID=218851 RepID=A0A2G5CTG4_AQUCA|nr:hypothetical protein AQUCO_03700098v1 [Aquilegia coerulea]